MRLITFAAEGRRVGALLNGDDTVLDLALAAPDRPEFASMSTLIESGVEGLDRARELASAAPEHALIPATAVRWCPPLPRPARMRDCGLFTQHLADALQQIARRQAEGAGDDPEAAFQELMASGRFTLDPLFTERVLYYNADPLLITGPNDTVAPPEGAKELDYELEFAVVVGRDGRDIPPNRARDHIFGYTIYNDWSARDLQLRLMQTGVGPGEGKDFATSLGPCLVTADEIADPYALTMIARINGEQWSSGSTSTMTHSFEDAIAQFSRTGGVFAGEVIASGTVASGTGFDAGKHLSSGDLVELEIEGIGILRNRVAL
ncbi:fumarylacetoacetate hydrolase family protein [Nocardia araoensis]|uniref:fumarylacetoacetate hydrolase family protein n=1 Tax=Nocardia araoensis TaxID=228600 RepID=UPI00030FCF8C|nr:fumarylacetoacetate hydrolase family protein [Nocardia araoensis]